MAQPMICDLCASQPAQILVTLIDTGDVQALDANCMTDFCLAYVKNTAPELLKPEPAKSPRKSQKKPAAAVADDSQGDKETAPAGDTNAG